MTTRLVGPRTGLALLVVGRWLGLAAAGPAVQPASRQLRSPVRLPTPAAA